MTDPSFSNTPAQPAPSNRNRTMIIIAVVVVLLLCCCCFSLVFGYFAWQCGDAFTGAGPVPGCPIALP
ncbi:MAG: hypothetical protein ACT4QE_21065 [Anaerolineales bacterium]